MCRSVFPSSGPNSGGTRVVIKGSDLGANAEEISVMLGNSACEVVESDYVPGK